MHIVAKDPMYDALEMIRKSVLPPTSPVALEIALSLIAERIARDLAEAFQLEAGVVPASWPDLPEHVTHRMRWIAERAILTLDPDHRLSAVAATTADLEKWLVRNPDATAGEIVQFSIGTFETYLQAVRR